MDGRMEASAFRFAVSIDQIEKKRSKHLQNAPKISLKLKKSLKYKTIYCTARQCSPLRRQFMESSILGPAVSPLMEHVVIGQRQKTPNFSAFHWSLHGRTVSIGISAFRNHEGDTFTEKDRHKFNYRIDRSGPNHRIGPGCAGRA